MSLLRSVLKFVVLERYLLRRRAIATRTTGPAGKHLQCSTWGKFRNSLRSDSLNFLSPRLRASSPKFESVATALRRSRPLVVG